MKNFGPGINGTLVGPIVIAVEGRDYYYSIEKHFGDHGLPKDIQLWDYKENGMNFAQGMKILVGLSPFRQGKISRLGIIRDAELGRDAATDSITTFLIANNFPVPKNQMEIATAAGAPSVAYLIMPHDKDAGCLDTAILEACIAPSDHVTMAREFIDKISAVQATPNNNLTDKRMVRAIIAGSGDKPYRTVSHCFDSLWSFKKPSIKVMLDFIELVQK